MNFLSIINELGNNAELAEVLQYNPQTKELTFTDPESGTVSKCYVNSLQALVNFFRENLLAASQLQKTNNLMAAWSIFYMLMMKKVDILSKYINFPIDENGMALSSSSYTQWLKITVQSIQILDELANTKGTWSSVYSISKLPEGHKQGPVITASFDGTIEWGDGTSSYLTAGKEVVHQYTANGDYTINVLWGTGLEVPEYAGEQGDSSVVVTTYTDWKFKKS